MSDSHSHAEIEKHKKVYLLIFGALLVGTFVTVALYTVHFQNFAITVAIALFVATVKASLVAGFFMHLISEKKAVYAILSATFFFFAAMMYLIVWSRGQLPLGSEYGPTKHIPHPTANGGSY